MSTCHSEYGTLESVIIKSAQNAFESQEAIDQQWQSLNYLGKPDWNSALDESAAFEKALQATGANTLTLPIADQVGLDSIYCRDASIATDFGMILCRMGKGARDGEPEAQAAFFESMDIPVLGRIESPGTLEGGDVAWLDEKTLAVGHTYRTNNEGIVQLKALLEPRGIEVIVAEMPHYKGPSDVFHLMSVLSPVDKDLAVVYSPLMTIAFRQELLERGFNFVECPEEEFESMGCNVLATGPRQCLVVEGTPLTRQRLEAAGCEVRVYQGQEISQYGCGGPTCLTRPLYRKV